MQELKQKLLRATTQRDIEVVKVICREQILVLNSFSATELVPHFEQLERAVLHELPDIEISKIAQSIEEGSQDFLETISKMELLCKNKFN